MNKIITTLFFIIVLSLLSSGVVFAATFCLNDPDACNDILLVVTCPQKTVPNGTRKFC